MAEPVVESTIKREIFEEEEAVGDHFLKVDGLLNGSSTAAVEVKMEKSADDLKLEEEADLKMEVTDEKIPVENLQELDDKSKVCLKNEIDFRYDQKDQDEGIPALDSNSYCVKNELDSNSYCLKSELDSISYCPKSELDSISYCPKSELDSHDRDNQKEIPENQEFDESNNGMKSEIDVEQHYQEENQKEDKEAIKKEKVKHRCHICKKVFPFPSKLSRHLGAMHLNEARYRCPFCKNKGFCEKNALNKHISYIHGEKAFKCTLCPKEDKSFYLKSDLDQHVKKSHSSSKDDKRYGCEICPLYFKYRKPAIIHLSTKHSGRDFPFYCGSCGVGFTREVFLNTHVKIHDVNVEKYSCEECNCQSFSDKETLNDHILMHSVENPYKCLACDGIKRFSSRRELEKHVKTDHKPQEKPFTCLICKDEVKSFTKKVYLDQHLKIHSNTKLPFECKNCGKTFLRKGHLTRHELLHKSDAEKPFKCELCTKSYCERSQLAVHINSTHSNSNFKCEKCNKYFFYKHSFNLHMKKHTGKGLLTCLTCSKEFVNKYKLDKHMVTHDKVGRFICKLCPDNKVFKSKRGLESHIVVHSGIKSYSCSVCPKQFFQSSNLVSHMKQHYSNDKPAFECEFCKRCFKRKYHLTSHRRQHTKETPYKCKKCSKSYANKESLKTHELYKHTDAESVKFFKCEECEVKCYTSSGLKVHSKIHSGLNKYPCDVCGKILTSQSNVNVHKRNVHRPGKVVSKPKNEEEKIECEICGKFLSVKSTLKRHMRAVHGKKVRS